MTISVRVRFSVFLLLRDAGDNWSAATSGAVSPHFATLNAGYPRCGQSCFPRYFVILLFVSFLRL
jgi:hypothetical protein